MTNSYIRKWNNANRRLMPSAILMIIGAIISAEFGKVQTGNTNHKIIALCGVIAFVIFSFMFVQGFTKNLYHLIAHHHLGAGRATAIRFVLRAVGYVAIFLVTLALLDIPVGRLLIGGAAVGIILGVAAQQALGNFFASIVLIISHPLEVGQDITVKSGALGGEYAGTVIDIGLTHTKVALSDDMVVALPNSTLLSSASIVSKR